MSNVNISNINYPILIFSMPLRSFISVSSSTFANTCDRKFLILLIQTTVRAMNYPCHSTGTADPTSAETGGGRICQIQIKSQRGLVIDKTKLCQVEHGKSCIFKKKIRCRLWQRMLAPQASAGPWKGVGDCYRALGGLLQALQGLTGGSGAGRGCYRVGAPHASRMGEGAFGSVLFWAIIFHSAGFSEVFGVAGPEKRGRVRAAACLFGRGIQG